ncbi:unnamed protein product [Effrenium voratum]|nr:unnamed protein product [Effrenium voratum]
MSNRSFMAPARVLQCLLPDVLNNEYVLYAISHSSNEDIFEFHGCQAIVSLGWRQAWRSASLDSVFSVLLAILFATLTVSLGQQQPVSGVLLVAAGVLVTTNLIKQLLLMQGMFVLGKFRLYWATVQNYVDWCRIGLSYSVLGLSYAQWAAPSAELSVLLAVAVLFRWADVVTSFRGYQWVGEKVLPIERALRLGVCP